MKLTALLSAVFAFGFTSVAIAQGLRVIEPDAASGSALAVVTPADAPLVFTDQIAEKDPLTALQALANILEASGSHFSNIVRLNFYVTKSETSAEIEKVLAATFKGSYQPAVTYVTTALPQADATVAVDAVAVTSKVGSGTKLLPPGVRIYVSGQAEKGDGTLADATKQTLLSLERTLTFLGLTKKDVVQVKSFYLPMAKWQEADQEISAYFGDHNPARAFVEWQSSLPIEIELVVDGNGNPELAKGPYIEIRTPPDMKASPVFSRLTIVRNTPLILISSLYPSDTGDTPDLQSRSHFTNLKKVLDATGSDWSNLVKATYYYSDDALSSAQNKHRPDYLNPMRPPASSKAKVSGVGKPGHGINMDMIAVPLQN